MPDRKPNVESAELLPSEAAAVLNPAELHQQLADRYKEFAALAGGLAHEIKNPLSTIRLNMELLAEELGDASENPRERRALAKIATVERECQRLQDLLDNFLSFAKPAEVRLEVTSLNQAVERVLDFMAPKAAEHRIEIVRYLDPNLPSVRLDRESFHAALLNLVLNADQAMPEGGQLMARTKRVGPDLVALDLIDTGCGMDAKTLAKIFQVFYSTKRGGSGLGLPTTRKIVEAHGGRLRVQSEVGRGTQFTLELPAANELAPKPAQLPNPRE